MAIGIDKIGAYPSTLYLEMEDLCAARGVPASEVRDVLLVDQRSVAPPWEDPVTLAVNAAAPLLDDEDRPSIELLVVGTETGLDQEKPLSSWVHRYLGLPSGCRNVEIKHACYGATAGIQLALAWLASAASPRAKALVVSTDFSLLQLERAHEYVLGCGAAAVLLSRSPRFLEVETDRYGVYAHEVADVIRPNLNVETGNSETSLLSYLEGLEGAYDAYLSRVGEVDFSTWFARNIYHVPFGGITFRAHKALLGRDRELGRDEAWADFERKTLGSLRYNRRVGGVYGASTLYALLGLVDGDPALSAGDRIGVYSYGSGSCAEFWSGLLGTEPRQVAAGAGLGRLLDARRRIPVDEYEAIERERDRSLGAPEYSPPLDLPEGHYDRFYRGQGRLVLRGVRDYVREYDWS